MGEGTALAEWLAASAHSVPSLSTCIKQVEGEGGICSNFAVCPPPRHSRGHQILYQGQVWSPGHGRLGLHASLPAQPPEDGLRMERAGLQEPNEGRAQSGRHSPLPRQASVVARVGWGTAGAGAGSLSLWVGRATAEWEGGQGGWQGGG